MSHKRRRLDWQWEEIVLACDLVYQNGWRQLDEGDRRVRELSGILQRISIHPLDVRLPNFRNFAGVAQKTRNIATVHPDYVGRPSNGNMLDKKVLDEFLDDPERMRSVAVSLRQLALADEPESASRLFGDEDESVMEGRYLLRFHRVRERSSKLRDKKIRSVLARGGLLICELCQFNFEEFYGDLGKGF
jgi:5-methylcytosine-specific restriction protein A